MTRRLTVAVTAACAALLLSGCAPSPTASPTPTPMTRSQAFAAAEATYRAYIDALNKVDLSDPATFEDVYQWETGDALASAEKSFSSMHADGWQVHGRTVATLVKPLSLDGKHEGNVDLAVCVDVSKVRVVDRNGDSVVAADREPVQAMQVTVSRPSSDTRWLIAQLDGRNTGPSCG